jgi:hypothetical protein
MMISLYQICHVQHVYVKRKLSLRIGETLCVLIRDASVGLLRYHAERGNEGNQNTGGKYRLITIIENEELRM